MSSEDAAKRSGIGSCGTARTGDRKFESLSLRQRVCHQEIPRLGRKSPAFAGACAWNGIREGNLVAANRRFWALFLW
jgi:hypothetical protein